MNDWTSIGVLSRTVLAVCFLLAACSAAMAVEAKRIMLLHSFGPYFKPWSEYAKSIRAELERQSPWPLDITEQSLVAARFADENPDAPFARYLASLFAKHPLDLVVSIGSPAASFVQRYRHEAFANTPMVFTAVEQRRVQFSALTDLDTVVAVKHDLPAIIANILRLLPETKRVIVVNGTSPLEQYWLAEMKKEFQPFEQRIEFIWTNTLSFDELLKRAATLPHDSAIFWELMIVDAAGVVHQGDGALERLHAVANAPIFSFDDSFFGSELVGGPMHSVLEGSQRTAEAAIRVLRGEKPSDVKTPFIGFAAPKYDWRELRRWNISENRLPPGSTIYFRDPDPWTRYRSQIIAIGSALLLQAALISWLIYEHWRRQVAEGEALRRLYDLARLNRFATAGELSASIAHEIRQPLAAIAASGSAGLNWLQQRVPNLDEVRATLQSVVDASHRADDIVKGVRAMFRNESTVRTHIDVNKLIQQVVTLTKRTIDANGITLTVNLSDQLPMVMGDPIQLQQTMLNLIVNAVEAMSASALRPRALQLWSQVNPDETVLIRVVDSGPGIDPKEAINIFQPLFTTKSGGMGMGLTICKTIVEAHGGKLVARSNTPSGMEFQIVLPQAQHDEVLAASRV